MSTANGHVQAEGVIRWFALAFLLLGAPAGLPAQVAFSPEPGFHPDGPIEVFLLPEDSTAVAVRYTLDGSPVAPDSPVFTEPLLLEGPAAVRARAVTAEGELAGEEHFASYLVGVESELPIFSIIIDPFHLWDEETGILANEMERGREWERPAHMTFVAEDRSEVTAIPAGLRVHGGYGSGEKRSLRLYFRSDYGASKFEHRVFPNSTVDKWDRVLLRSGSQDSRFNWTMIRNQPIYDLFLEMGQYAPAGDFSLVWLNGEPWGIYNHMEYLDDRYLRYAMGIIGGEGDMIRTDWGPDAREGTVDAYWDFRQFYADNPATTDDLLDQYAGRMDLRNHMLYYILQIIIANRDWPQNNMDLARAWSGEARWRWILYDVDISQGMIGDATDRTLEWALRDRLREDIASPDYVESLESTLLVRQLLENPGHRGRFIQTFAHLLNTWFSTESMLPRIDAAAARIEGSIPIENEAWQGILPQRSLIAWRSHVENVRTFWRERPDFLREDLRASFDLPAPVIVEVLPPAAGEGWIAIEGDRIDTVESWTGLYFPGLPLDIQAVPARGHVFAGWTDPSMEGEPARFPWTVDGPRTLQATFIHRPEEPAPNDVIINEYWVDDDRIPHDSIEGRSIEGSWVEILVARPGGVDLRGWRITNNEALATSNSGDPGEGSLNFPDIAELAHVPHGTVILIIPTVHMHNTEMFHRDELDASTGRMIFHAGNGNLDGQTDPGFSIRRQDDPVVLLHPGDGNGFGSHRGIDFIAEGDRVTPESFGIAAHGVEFPNPFAGIGGGDGAIFTNDPAGGLNNDDGSDPDRTDALPGPGGWIVDPPGQYTGGDPDHPDATNILTPGAINHGQVLPTHEPRDLWLMF